MITAEQGKVARPLWRAALFRDGLMIVMLACRPLRRENFASLRIGLDLVRHEGEYRLLNELRSEAYAARAGYESELTKVTGQIDRLVDALAGGAAVNQLGISFWLWMPESRNWNALSRALTRPLPCYIPRWQRFTGEKSDASTKRWPRKRIVGKQSKSSEI